MLRRTITSRMLIERRKLVARGPRDLEEGDFHNLDPRVISLPARRAAQACKHDVLQDTGTNERFAVPTHACNTHWQTPGVLYLLDAQPLHKVKPHRYQKHIPVGSQQSESLIFHPEKRLLSLSW
jgi:hypothetical protein